MFEPVHQLIGPGTEATDLSIALSQDGGDAPGPEISNGMADEFRTADQQLAIGVPLDQDQNGMCSSGDGGVW